MGLSVVKPSVAKERWCFDQRSDVMQKRGNAKNGLAKAQITRKERSMKRIKVKATFINPILGSASANAEIHREFIASKAPDAPSREEEVEAIGVDEVERKEMTVFARTEEGTPHLWDYQIKGFFKHACGMLKNVPGTESSKIKAYKKFIDGLVFVEERKIPLVFEGEVGSLQRPLRGQTAQGERIALANSEMCPAGTTITFTVKALKDDLIDAVKEWLDYGELNGLGQWHNSGMGAFKWEEEK